MDGLPQGIVFFSIAVDGHDLYRIQFTRPKIPGTPSHVIDHHFKSPVQTADTEEQPPHHTNTE